MEFEQLPNTSGSTTRSEAEISMAIRECATLCFEHPRPRQCIDNYVAELLRNGWTDDDASDVKADARRVVVKIMGKPIE